MARATHDGPLITQLAFRDARKLTSRESFNLVADYKFSPRLSFSLRTFGAHMDDGVDLEYSQQLVFGPAWTVGIRGRY